MIGTLWYSLTQPGGIDVGPYTMEAYLSIKDLGYVLEFYDEDFGLVCTFTGDRDEVLEYARTLIVSARVKGIAV